MYIKTSKLHAAMPVTPLRDILICAQPEKGSAITMLTDQDLYSFKLSSPKSGVQEHKGEGGVLESLAGSKGKQEAAEVVGEAKVSEEEESP